MSREYVYFLSHAPTGSLCSIGSLCSLGSLGSLPLHFASDIYGLIQKVKSPQKKRSCSPSQHRTLRPFPYTSAIRQQYYTSSSLHYTTCRPGGTALNIKYDCVVLIPEVVCRGGAIANVQKGGRNPLLHCRNRLAWADEILRESWPAKKG